MYTDLIFDLYGTLVDIHTEESMEVWTKTALFFGYYGAHYAPKELKDAFEEQIHTRKATAGQSYECFPDIPFHAVMADLFRAKGIHTHADTLGINAAQLFRICSTEYIQLYPHVLESLAVLRKAGFRLWLLSNAQEVFTRYELNHLGLTKAFHEIYISSQFGFRKPDRRFFNALLAEQNLDRNTCLMIGNDRETDIAGARAAGLDAFYIHTELTPPDQSPADPLNPLEFEGEDWEQITKILLTLKKAPIL